MHTQAEAPLTLTAPVAESGRAVSAEATTPQATVSGSSVTVEPGAAGVPGVPVDRARGDLDTVPPAGSAWRVS